VLRSPPHPSPLPQFFASILPSNNTLSLSKKSRERGQNGAVQPSTRNQALGTKLPADRIHRSAWLNETGRVDFVALLLGRNTAEHRLSNQLISGI
jgi:hypothetical protein